MLHRPRLEILAHLEHVHNVCKSRCRWAGPSFPDAPRCWRVQKQMYQQQPATVGLRGQAPNRYPPPAPRPQQRPVDVQQLQNSSLSIHDKRRQPVAPLKR